MWASRSIAGFSPSHSIHSPRARRESEALTGRATTPCVAHRYLAPFHTPQPVEWGEALFASGNLMRASSSLHGKGAEGCVAAVQHPQCSVAWNRAKDFNRAASSGIVGVPGLEVLSLYGHSIFPDTGRSAQRLRPFSLFVPRHRIRTQFTIPGRLRDRLRCAVQPCV
jgi:hypothetical protein